MKRLNYLESLDVMLSCDYEGLTHLGVWSYLEDTVGVSMANQIRHSLGEHIFHAQLALQALSKIKFGKSKLK